MAITLATKPFDIHSIEKDAVTLRDYTGDASTLSFKRVAPKRVKEFPGMERTEVKHTLTGVDGNIIGLQTVTTSIRADATPADRQAINEVTKAVIAASVYDALLLDQRLPTSV